MKILILFSGGIDSTSLIPYYLDLDYQVELLFINYGQASFNHETNSVKSIASFYNLPVKHIDLSNLGKFSGKILARNSFLIFSAIMYSQIEKGIISLGIHKGTDYPDCKPIFLDALQNLLDKQELNSIKIDTPFIEMYKNEIWDFAHRNNVPIDLTYSCELGLKQPCKFCPSCKDLIKLYESAN